MFCNFVFKQLNYVEDPLCVTWCVTILVARCARTVAACTGTSARAQAEKKRTKFRRSSVYFPSTFRLLSAYFPPKFRRSSAEVPLKFRWSFAEVCQHQFSRVQTRFSQAQTSFHVSKPVFCTYNTSNTCSNSYSHNSGLDYRIPFVLKLVIALLQDSICTEHNYCFTTRLNV